MDAAEYRRHLTARFIEDNAGAMGATARALGLDTEDQHVRTAITELCIRVFNTGVRAGATEAIAQLSEQGVHAQLNMDPFLLDDASDVDA